MGFYEAEQEYLNPDSVYDDTCNCERCGKIIKGDEGYYYFKPDVICEKCRDDYLTDLAQDHYVG